MNYKDIQKEFDKTKFAKEGGSCFECCDYEGMYLDLKDFLKAKINQVIDDMIGEEKIQCDCDDPKRELYKEWCGCKTKDYNKKVQELKEYKVKFNKYD